MRRINVIGTSGSGKSYFAKALAERLGFEYIQMDQLHWKPNWVESTTEELLAKLASKISADTWVLDGNYSKTNAIKWDNVDTIICLDYSFVKTFYQVFCRSIQRIWTRQELWPDTGNIETWRGTFLSSDSILIWCMRTYSKNRKSYGALQKSAKHRHINIIRLRSRADANNFLEEVSRRKITQDNQL